LQTERLNASKALLLCTGWDPLLSSDRAAGRKLVSLLYDLTLSIVHIYNILIILMNIKELISSLI